MQIQTSTARDFRWQEMKRGKDLTGVVKVAVSERAGTEGAPLALSKEDITADDLTWLCKNAMTFATEP